MLSLHAAGIFQPFAAGSYGPNPGTSVSPSNNSHAFAVSGTANNDSLLHIQQSRTFKL